MFKLSADVHYHSISSQIVNFEAIASFPQGVIGPGGVQWMTAGRGIVHREMPKMTEGNLWGFQLWINLPKKDKMVKPRSVTLPGLPVHARTTTAFTCLLV